MLAAFVHIMSNSNAAYRQGWVIGRRTTTSNTSSAVTCCVLLVVFVRIPHSTSDVEAGGDGGIGHSPSAVDSEEGTAGCMASPCIEWLFSGVRVKKVGTCASPF